MTKIDVRACLLTLKEAAVSVSEDESESFSEMLAKAFTFRVFGFCMPTQFDAAAYRKGCEPVLNSRMDSVARQEKRRKHRVCDSCGQLDVISKCGNCFMACYCSPKCQRVHWKRAHRFYCKQRV